MNAIASPWLLGEIAGSTGRRQSEALAPAAALAHRLHGSLRNKPARAPARVERTEESPARAAPLPIEPHLARLRAEARPTLARFAAAAFRRRARGAGPGATEALGRLAAVLCQGRLEEGLERALIDAVAHPELPATILTPLLALVELPSFSALNPTEGHDAIRLVIGPMVKGRTLGLQRAYEGRRRELQALLSAPQFLGGPPAAQLTLLRALLYAPSEPVSILESEHGDHVSVVIGARPGGLARSYGQRRAALLPQSPEPWVARGWPERGPGADIVYQRRTVVVSREEERALIEHLEAAVDAPRKGRSLLSARLVLEAIRALCGEIRLHSEGLFRAGRPYQRPARSAADRAAAEILARFLGDA